MPGPSAPASAEARRLCVLGMGNILYHDEGVGVYAAHYLRAAFRFTPEIEIVDGAALGFGLMSYFTSDRRLVVLDALLTTAPPGTVYRLPEEQLLDLDPTMRPTAHEVEPIELLKLTTLVGQAPGMVLLGIVPADVTQLRLGLSTEIAQAFPHLVEAAIAELRGGGVAVDAVRQIGLEDVIEDMVMRTW
ncbi:MAG: hydrogenase maturation protease [Actinobacteria bacterium]|nr:hydrogenase maturation protease [Actinomycetota bacterium]